MAEGSDEGRCPGATDDEGIICREREKRKKESDRERERLADRTEHLKSF